ncbi:MAG: ribonuclease III [Clostridia bacterium]|nr:ribonuclease III [Clostridia bacterium]
MNVNEYSPLALAYLGDAYYELMVRAHLLEQGNMPASELNKRAKEYVTAVKQSEMVEALLPHLSETELAAYKRGRNAHSPHTPKSAAAVQYRRATGLESLFGYLYVKGETERALSLFRLLVLGGN